MQKTSGTLHNFLKIFCVLIFIVIAIEIFGIILLTVKPDNWFATEFSYARLFSPFINNVEDVTLSIPAIIMALVTNLLHNIALLCILLIAAAIFRDISHHYTPFSSRHISRLKGISLLIMADAILIPPLGMLLTMIFAPNVEAAMEFSLLQIVLAVVFYCLSQIFEYGGALQQQSDETL